MEEKNRLKFQLEQSVPVDQGESDDVARFAESYASFNRIVNSLQRKYIELRDEFDVANEQLADVNSKLAEANESHRAVNEFLKQILGSVRVGVIAVDRQGRITHFNPAASLILGVPQSVATGKLYRDVIPAGKPFEANALRTAESGRVVDSTEKRLELSDGARLQLSVSTSVLENGVGERTGAVEVFHDLTAIKKMEQELARLNTLAALGEMAATVAHQVRNPLAGISGFAALLERDMDDDDPRRKLVEKILRGTENLNQTVSTLLDYTRSEEANKTQGEFGEFLRQTVDQFRLDNAGRLSRMQIILNDCPTPHPQELALMFDHILLRQVMFNVFSNAVEACDGSGTIHLSVRKLPRQAALSRYADRMILGIDETVLETTVSDTGPGFEQRSLEQVFAPFYTTRQGGSGLGLAVAWKIMKAHNGEILAHNGEDAGAVISILLPVKVTETHREHSA
ncbi:MAG: PAS domain-containing sensor histidine kinase [Candidatus Zixiibacteriota bacterium]